jgi:predicted RNase H-like HicB family nuclease
MIKDSDRYLKIVEWSEADNCYLGSAPGLIEHCCHGMDEKQVFNELCIIIDEWLVLLRQQNKELPPPCKVTYGVGSNLQTSPSVFT